MRPRPAKSTLFPYTTLFRSIFRRREAETSREWLERIVRSRFTKREFDKRFQSPSAMLAAYREVAQYAVKHLRTHDTSVDRKSTRLNSSHGYISYAVFCLKKR